MKKKIKHWLSIREYRNLLANFSSLSLVQISNYILPLITIPYLTRVLGASHFGLIMMAQATMIYLTLLTDYGFNLSATKEISILRKDTSKVSEITSAVLVIKTMLLCIGLITLTILIEWVPIFNDHKLLFYLSFLIVIGNTYLPTFLFQGLEKMTFIAIFNLIAKSAFTGLIFIIIQSKSDYYLVHALWGLSFIAVDLAGFWIMKTRLNIRLSLPKWTVIQSLYQLSFEYFLSRVAIAIYLNTNIILVGIMLSTSMAGYYSGSEKLLFAITTFYAPLIETIYPYISKSRNISFIKKVLVITIGINIIGCSLAFILAPIIIPLILGPEFNASVQLFQWMLIIAVLHLPNSLIGYPVLGALGYEKVANRSGIFGAMIHILLIIIFYQQLQHPLHFIWIMIASQSTIFSIRMINLIQLKQKEII